MSGFLTFCSMRKKCEAARFMSHTGSSTERLGIACIVLLSALGDDIVIKSFVS
jgi:hypothetical protein